MDQQARNYAILANILGWASGVVAVVIAGIYWLNPTLLRAGFVGFLTAVLAATTFGYFISAHQLVKRRALQLSTLLLALATAITIILVIAQTGGLDSPYYALWLLAIIIAGIFGTAATISVTAATIIIYAVDYWTHRQLPYPLVNRLIQLALTIAAAGIAEWIHSRTHRTQSQDIATLSGRLGQEQLKAQALMSAMGEGVIVVNPKREIQLFNHAAQLLTGLDEHSAQNLDYRTVLKLKTAAGDDLTDANDPFLMAWQRGTTLIEKNLVLVTQAGRHITITMTVSPIMDGSGQIAGGIALFRDITAEREVERQRDEFISTASHEMRTPIAAIEGYVSLAMNPATATVDARAQGYLEKAHHSIGNLGALFRDLLDVTKLEDNQIKDRLTPTNLSELVQRAADDMRVLAKQKGLTLGLVSGNEITTSSRTILPIYSAMVNPDRLREVVTNLIENAIKYTPSGQITIKLTATPDTVTTSVSDTGNGIASEDLPHLFQKFYRVDNSTTRTIGGTGLGLYICRTIIELYNGQVWAESKLGEGSTFSFRLPRVANQPAAAAVTAPLVNPTVVSPAAAATPTGAHPAFGAAIDGLTPNPPKLARPN